MFGRKKRKARKEAAERAAADATPRPHDETHHRTAGEAPAEGEPMASPLTEHAEPTAAPPPPAAPLRSLLTDGERLGFEPELETPAD